jgi:hypothetical protein
MTSPWLLFKGQEAINGDRRLVSRSHNLTWPWGFPCNSRKSRLKWCPTAVVDFGRDSHFLTHDGADGSGADSQQPNRIKNAMTFTVR